MFVVIFSHQWFDNDLYSHYSNTIIFSLNLLFSNCRFRVFHSFCFLLLEKIFKSLYFDQRIWFLLFYQLGLSIFFPWEYSIFFNVYEKMNNEIIHAFMSFMWIIFRFTNATCDIFHILELEGQNGSKGRVYFWLI